MTARLEGRSLDGAVVLALATDGDRRLWEVRCSCGVLFLKPESSIKSALKPACHNRLRCPDCTRRARRAAAIRNLVSGAGLFPRGSWP